MSRLNTTSIAIAAFALLLSMRGSAFADAVEGFYRGKTVTFLVGSGYGGSYDLYARALAGPLSRHIPGKPEVVIKFTGGAGAGLPAAIQMQKAAPRDGTMFCMTQQTIPVSQSLETVAAGKYDVRTWN
jgi:tripartite-type tricarboxylate transporter receptor subunit TctC